MSIELDLAVGVFQGMTMFVSPNASATDPNPNSATHLRYYDDNTIRIACTNGKQIVFLRLDKDTDQLGTFFWPEEERECVVSILLNSQALAAMGKMGARVTVSIGTAHAKLHTPGETGTTAIEVPRLYGRQINLFDDMDNIKPVTLDDLTPRGQLRVNPKVLAAAAKAAKLVGCGNPLAMNVAQIGQSYGINFGTDEAFWILTPTDSTVTPLHAGLPPYWVTGQASPEHELAEMINEVFVHVTEEDDAELPQLTFADERAPIEPVDLADLDDGPEEFADVEAAPDGEFSLDDLPEIPADDTPAIDLSDKTDDELVEIYANSDLPSVRSAAAELLRQRVPNWKPAEER